MITFAAISPHPPILLPSVGSKEDREKLKKTLSALAILAEKLKKANPETIVISSPHPDWGFNVPLYFLLRQPFPRLAAEPVDKPEIKTYLTGLEPPEFYFEKGKKVYQSGIKGQNTKVALIASGDLSHCLKEDGPYGFNAQGPEFDKALIKFLKEKDIKNFLKLDELFPQAAECGLRSFSFLLGILEAAKITWQPEILSYEGPFGVGYLVANFSFEAL